MSTIIHIKTFRNRLDKVGDSHSMPLHTFWGSLLKSRQWDRRLYDHRASLIKQACAFVFNGTDPVEALSPIRWVSNPAKIFQGKTGDEGSRCAQLFHLLIKKTRAEVKGSFKAWSPTIYKEGMNRGSDAVDSVTCMVYDFDEGDFTFESVREHWEWLGIQAGFHTSSSHGEKQARLRVIIPLAVPCPVEKWEALWQWGYEYSGQMADPATKDAGRIYYLNYQPFEQYLPKACATWGKLLDWRELSLPEKKKPVTPAPQKKSSGAAPGSNIYNESAEHREALGIRLGGRSRNGYIKGVCCPRCGDTSLWWYISTDGGLKAKCNHLDSCPGTSVWLDELEAIR